jgi:2-polyprenyl-3-methyl-5-hydroxy-6-metoxy-1,4-benzoquinol methylase
MIVLDSLDARIPQWDVDQLTARLCPFCETENRAVLKRPDLLPVAFCAACGCWYVCRLPLLDEIRGLYDGYWDVHCPSDLSRKSVSRMLESAQRTSKTNWHLQALSKLLGGLRGRRILDVGCGTGGFLLAARSEGADVVGCDVCPRACDFVREQLGIPVHHAELEACASRIGHVDAITMINLVEHPVHPLAGVRAARGILNTEGLLLLHTPNGGEAGRDIETAKKWVGFRVDLEHLQYFSPQTINWLSRELGLQIESLETEGFPLLKGIDKLPQSRRRRPEVVERAKDVARNVPGARPIVRFLRAAKSYATMRNRDARLGSYNLTTILRKR